MKLFECQNCGNLVYFENTSCEACGHRLGYLPMMSDLSALQGDDDLWRPLADPDHLYRFCANSQQNACNWLIPDESHERFCTACRHNRTIPDLSRGEYRERWRRLEIAKHRLIYTLLALELPLQNKVDNPEHGLAFDFMADPDAPTEDSPRVMTGHENGIVTINLIEADDVTRERLRSEMNEPYRTLLGHLRHEVGHHYWERLVRDGPWHAAFRATFGDERQDYGQALRRHYSEGPPPDWREHFVSSYATSHPWEDFAETWAHYLHIVDTLETGASFGLSVDPLVENAPHVKMDDSFSPYRMSSVEEIVAAWFPLAFAANNLNRSMGQPDLYPFILPEPAIHKLGFIHDLIRQSQAAFSEPIALRA
ncbi:hypothetical protein FHS85_003716 [Rhodoligotrophos appendicifer]|uniref:zinc-binding metallopeptidase family protein n=1 Tax=Rhodoligotrophos appendicifer TaxID=987056 RepID=UPI001184F4E2|nr:putative zinc-binding peptidase [Rhodoligotrophos appendicifer]